MTTAAFARLETRVNEAAIRHIANAEATALDDHGASVQIPVIFDAAGAVSSTGLMGMAGTQPAVTLATADVVTDWQGWQLTINGATYAAVAHTPDGTGLSVLALEQVA